MTRYTGTIGRTARDVADAQRVRWRVYGEEESMISASACVNGREIDAHDGHRDTIHVIVRADEEVVGTVRLLLGSAAPPVHADAAQRRRVGLDLDSRLDLTALAAPGVVLAEITRFCVLRAYRGTGVTPALFAALRAESARRGITHWVAVANTETDVIEDANLAHQIARAKKLVSPHLDVTPRAPAPPAPRRVRPCYTPDQRLRARLAPHALADLDLPRTLSVFARRMGARFVGGPYYEPDFGVFALPLVVALGDAAAPVCTSTTYPVSPTGTNAARRPPPSPGGGSW